MRSLVLKMSMSADGFVCGPKGELAWLFGHGDASSLAWLIENISGFGAHLMGSRTYQDMASYWPYTDDPISVPMNAAPKIVFTRRTAEISPGSDPVTQGRLDAQKVAAPGQVQPSAGVLKDWQSPRIMRGDLATNIRALKAEEGGPLLAHGGAGFGRSLIATGLIDEYRLVVSPVVLGQGQPVFSEIAGPMKLALISSRAFPGGVVANVYRPRA